MATLSVIIVQNSKLYFVSAVFLLQLLTVPSLPILDAYGVQGGQNESIAVLNLNSYVPIFIVTAPVINAYTPAIVETVELIASSQDLVDKIRSFLGISSDSTPVPTPSPVGYQPLTKASFA